MRLDTVLAVDSDYADLGDLGYFAKGSEFTKADIVNDGAYPVVWAGRLLGGPLRAKAMHATNGREKKIFATGEEILWAGDAETPDVLATSFSVTDPGTLIASNIYYPDTSILLPAFGAAAIRMLTAQIARLTKGNTIHHLYAKDLANLKIPLPSLEVQNQIVSILDAHSELAELQAERVRLLKLEKDVLLEKIFAPDKGFKFSIGGKNFDTAGWGTYRFQDRFSSIHYSGGVGNRNLENTGRYPVISQSQRSIDGFTDVGNLIPASAENPVIIFGDHTTIVKFSDEPFVVGGPGVKLFTVNDGDPRFFYEALRQNGPVSNGYRRHSSMLATCNFIAPNLEDQQLISEYFREVDSRIRLEEDRLQLLRTQSAVVLEAIFKN